MKKHGDCHQSISTAWRLLAAVGCGKGEHYHYSEKDGSIASESGVYFVRAVR